MVKNIPENVALDKSSQTEFSKAMKTIKSRVKKGDFPVPTDKKKNTHGVLYLSHIPHGFYEKEMQGFFSQFGDITRLKLARSKKTGRSKGYAFIEFAHNEVAQIAAETMNNYLMYTKLVKAKYLAPEEVSEAIFFGRKFTPENCPGVTARNLERKLSNRQLTGVQAAKKRSKARKKLANMQQKLNEAGINYTIQMGGSGTEKMKLPVEEKDMSNDSMSEAESEAMSDAVSDTSEADLKFYEVLQLVEEDKKRKSKSPYIAISPNNSVTPVQLEALIEAEISKLSPKSPEVKTPLSGKKSLQATPKSGKSPKGTPKSNKSGAQDASSPLWTPKMMKTSQVIHTVDAGVEKFTPAKKNSPVTPASKKSTPASFKVLSAKKSPFSTPKSANTPEKPLSVKKTPKSTPVAVETPLSAKKTPKSTPVAVETPLSAKKTPKSTPVVVETPLSAKKTPKSTPVADKTPLSAKKTPKSTPVAVETPLSAKKTPKSTPVAVETPLSAKKTPKSTPVADKTPCSAKKTPKSTPVVVKNLQKTPKFTPIASERPMSAKKTSVGTPQTSNTPERPMSNKKTPKSTPVTTEKPMSAKKTPIGTPKLEKPVSAKKSPIGTPQNTKVTPKAVKTPETEAESVVEAEKGTKRAGRKSVINLKTPSPRKTRSGKIIAGKKSPLKSLQVSQLQTTIEEPGLTPTRRSTRKSIAVLKAKSPVTPKVNKRHSLAPTPKSAKKTKIV